MHEMTRGARAGVTGNDDPTASIGPEHAPPIPASLSCMPRKRALFGVDTYFRDSWEDACDCLGRDVDDFARSHACVLVKPDAVVSRRVVPVLDWLAEYGATIVAAERCLLT